jgi:formamidopyrimidine-DNA glycosylase
MPELPEVEAARLLCEEHLVGRTLAAVRPVEDTKLFGPDGGRAFASLVGRRLLGAHRHGKHLWLQFAGAGPAALALHFGMTGSVAVRGVGRIQYVNAGTVDNAVWPPPFTKLALDFSAGGGGGASGPPPPPATTTLVEAAFADPRRFGKVRLVADPRAGLPAGRDVLTDPPSPAALAAALAAAGPARKVKPWLMDQAVLAGVGNWVADEVLWAARIHPEAGAATLSDAQAGALAAALRAVVSLAAAARADDSRYPRSWIFHTRWGKAAGATVEGHRIAFIDVGGRTTAYVPGLQKKGERAAGREGGGGGGGDSAKRRVVKAEPASPAPPPVQRPPVKRVKEEKAVEPPRKGAVAKPRAGAAKGRAAAPEGATRRATRGGRG